MLHITGIGIDADIGVLHGELSVFEEHLQFFSSCGFESVELSVDSLDVIINGCLQPRQVEKIRAVTAHLMSITDCWCWKLMDVFERTILKRLRR